MTARSKSALAVVAAELEALRAGRQSFDELHPVLYPHLRARAAYFWRKWRGLSATHMRAEDLVSIMALRLWQAVDEWDPSRGKSLVSYVDWQVGHAAELEIRRVLHWPDPRYVRQQGVELYLADMVGGVDADTNRNTLPGLMRFGHYKRDDLSLFHTRAITKVFEDVFVEDDQTNGLLLRCEVEAQQERRLAWWIENLTGFPREIVKRVSQGSSVAEAAEAIYADCEMRLEFRLDNAAEARERGAQVARSVAAVARKMRVGPESEGMGSGPARAAESEQRGIQ